MLLTDWEYFIESDGHGSWYRLLDCDPMQAPEGLEITFRNGKPIVAAIFEQRNGPFICSCKSNDPEIRYGEMDDFWADDDVLEVIMLKLDIKLHGYGYKVIPCQKVLKK